MPKFMSRYLEQRKAFEGQFPAIYDSAERWIQDDLAAFLTASLLGLLDIVEQEIDTLYATEHSIVQLDQLAMMFEETRTLGLTLTEDLTTDLSHSIGSSGGQLPFYVEGSSALDFPSKYDVGPQDQT
jgi:hypothetical protein